ncbi:MAG TPA: hypothetical protein VGF45_05700 [Polyangia bacterium]
MMEVRSNFLADLGQVLQALLESEGIKTPALNTPDLCRMYFNIAHRQIVPKPRSAIWSAELRAKSLSPEILAGLRQIETSSARGEDLSPRQSTQYGDVYFTDMLLNDWGIQHFHLGTDAPGPNKRVARDRQVLFVVVTDASLLFADVFGHEFCRDELLEIVQRNWPEWLEPHRAQNAVSAPPIPESRRKAFRGPIKPRGGRLLLPSVMRDGTVYVPPGGGYFVDGSSVTAGRKADALLTEITGTERSCRQQAEVIRDRLHERCGQRLAELRLRLVWDGNGVRIQEEQCGVLL